MQSAYTSPALFPSIPLHQLLPYPISRYEAELQWEFGRQEVRARIKSLPTSSFERTKLEADERFYATFPEARQAAMDFWIAREYPFAPWSLPCTFVYEDVSRMDFGYECQSAPHLPTSIHHPRPAQTFSNYSLVHALTAPASPCVDVPASPSQADFNSGYNSSVDHDPDLSIMDNVSNDCPGSQGCPAKQESYQCHASAGNPSPSCVTPPPPQDEQVIFALQVLAPSRRQVQRPARNTRSAHVRPAPYAPPVSRNQEPLYPPTCMSSSKPLCPPTSLRPSSNKSSAEASFNRLQYTGDWEADAIAASKYPHTSTNLLIIMDEPTESEESLVETLPIRREHASHRAHRPAPRLRPSRATAAKPASPPRSTDQPIVARKRPKLLRDKDGKPVLACLFCRGRKIACGPPPNGSDNPTCNQCARRGLTCIYPTESCRGMRTKRADNKTSLSRKTSSDYSDDSDA